MVPAAAFLGPAGTAFAGESRFACDLVHHVENVLRETWQYQTGMVEGSSVLSSDNFREFGV